MQDEDRKKVDQKLSSLGFERGDTSYSVFSYKDGEGTFSKIITVYSDKIEIVKYNQYMISSFIEIQLVNSYEILIYTLLNIHKILDNYEEIMSNLRTECRGSVYFNHCVKTEDDLIFFSVLDKEYDEDVFSKSVCEYFSFTHGVKFVKDQSEMAK